MKSTTKSLYVAKVVSSTSVDGVGLRNSLYVSGCNLYCPECQNKHWWTFLAGQKMSIQEVFEALNNDECNISILGGEPLMQYPAILDLCKMIKKRTQKTIWLWTGHTIENIQFFFGDLLKYVDVVVDGPYKHDLRDTTLAFRGSSNQRIYEVKHTPIISISDISENF